MEKTDELFGLIKILDASEKRYFKRYASIHSDKKDSVSIQIFDLLEKMKEYSEEKLKNHFKDQKTEQHIHVSKNYLLKNLLKSLRSYHHSFSKESEIKDQIIQIEILSQKKQYELAYKLLQRSFKQALEYELFLQMVELIIWAHRLRFYEPTLLQETEDFLTNEELQKYLVISEWDARLEILVFETIQHITQQSEKLPTIPTTLGKVSGVMDVFVYPKSQQLFLQGLHAYHNHQLSEAYDYISQAAACYSSKNHLIAEKPARYFLILAFKIDIAIALKHYPEALQILIEAKTIYNSLKTHKIKAIKEDFEINYFHKFLVIYNGLHKFQESYDYYHQELKELIISNPNYPIHYLVTVWLQLAYTCFALGKYEESLQFISLIAQKELDYRPFMHFIYWLSVLNYYHLSNFVVVEYKLEQFKQWLQQHSHTSFSDEFFSTFVQAIQQNNLTLLRSFIENRPEFQFELHNFDFTAWLQASLAKQTLAQYTQA